MIDIKPASAGKARPRLSISLVGEGGGLEQLAHATPEAAAAARADGFKGQKDKAFYRPGATRLLWVGLGPDKGRTLEAWRRAGQAAARRARELKVEEALLTLPSRASLEETAALAEGAWLGLYKYEEGKGKPSPEKEKDKGPELKRLLLKGGPSGLDAMLRERRAVCEAVCLARDLVNRGPSEKHPARFARDIMALARGVKGLKVKVLAKKAIQAWPMAGLLAVNQGSQHPPVFLHLHYRPSGRARRKVALVGKGVTFDSGGLSLKPAGAMMDMKCDMAGAATVMALVLLAAKLKLKVEVHACAPLTENLPGADAVKIGDVIRYRNGRTAEMCNTDAEGRVILADGLLYAETLKPDVLLDFATLTGAAISALGMNITALLGDDALCNRFRELGKASGEAFWQLPLHEDYRKHIESKVADIKNVGNSGEAGTMAGAFYLKEFVTTKAWVHFDIAGPAFLKAEDGVNPAGATGIPLRTVWEYLKSL